MRGLEPPRTYIHQGPEPFLLGSPVGEDDDVVDVEAAEQVAVAAACPGGELRGEDQGRRRGANQGARRQLPVYGRREGERVPGVREAEDRLVGRHHVEREPRSTLAPAADAAVADRFGEAAPAQPVAEAAVGGQPEDVADRVDVVGGADGRRSGVREPEVDARAAAEDEFRARSPSSEAASSSRSALEPLGRSRRGAARESGAARILDGAQAEVTGAQRVDHGQQPGRA